jgi:phosphoglycerol transferase MdoB-like AlkP superfamily enzyme
MKRIKLLVSTYFLFVLFFTLQKIIFLLYHWNESSQETFGNLWGVISHGVQMDLTVAGYVTILPLLILLLSVCFTGKWFARVLQWYFGIISALIAIIFISDMVLYSYWGFRMDDTVLGYIVKPKESMASVPYWMLFIGIAAMGIIGYGQYYLLKRWVIKTFLKLRKSAYRIIESIIIVLLAGVMFIAIRGGVFDSTMNMGRVYFSENMYLNQAAVNPVFSLLYSMNHSENFAEQYRFMDDEDAHKIFNQLMSYEKNAPEESLLKTTRPNIIFILLESFGADIMEPLGGEKGVTPNLNQLAEESIFFTKMYANSFRTDRGLVATTGGYPAQPNMSIIRNANKCNSLKSIPQTLFEEGYKTSFLYGGDVDFAGMKTYLVSQKVTDLTSYYDFPSKEQTARWGVPDHFSFKRFSEQINDQKEEPYFKMFLTLSSHEPFDVPYKKFKHPYLNSAAYTDSCLGVFIDDLKKSKHWENTLVILVPDHKMGYPEGIANFAPERHAIFMVWAGGAIKKPVRVDKFCSQTDIAATLLSQLHIDYSDFPFSKDILNPTAPEFAFYTFKDGFGMVNPDGTTVFDNTSGKIISQTGGNNEKALQEGKAYLQCLFDDIAQK